ncbi:hypothetical protein ACP70R_000709 [Stipagrostis hirtigluma subsp. patula]
MPAHEEHSLPTGFGTRPWLVQATRGTALTLVDASDRSLHEATVPELEGKTCLGCVHNGDWLVLLDESTGECFLLSLTGGPRRRPKIPLPPLREPLDHLATCAMLGSPGHPGCTVMVASSAEAEEPFLLHGRPGEPEWTRLVSPFDGITFTSMVINYKEKVYAFASSNNLIVIDLVDGEIRAQKIGTIQDEEEGGGGSGYYPHLVESCGDLFAVWIQELGLFGHDGVLTDILVYHLDLSDTESMVWRRVEGISSDRTFLLSGGYGFSCAAINGKMEGNCVYLVWSCCDCERLYKFCLDDMTVSYHQILPQPTHPWCRAFWSVPANIQAMEVQESALSSSFLPKKVDQLNDLDKHIEELNDLDKHFEEVQADSLPQWHDLPLELLELVVSNLSLVDRLRFPAVCKSWSMVTNPVGRAKAWPWLMHCSRQDGLCKMFDPLLGKEYTLQVVTFETNEERHIFRSSKGGWLVVSGGSEDDEIFIINPFTGELVEDPPILERSYYYNGFSFSSTPMSLDCVFFGINSSHSGHYVSIYTWRHGEDTWSELEFEYEESFPVARNNPVFFRGKFYCLGRKGNLGVFDPKSQETESAWKILEKPEPVHAEMELFDDDHEGREFCYLVELEGELVSVFMRNDANPPRVFKLDETKMTWTEVEEIGDAALFLDSRASYAVVSPEGGHGNRIYFPRFSEDGKQAAFYDMETKMYHPSFYGLKQPLKCVWVVPNLVPSFRR